jgi:hypothetical protein
MAFSQATITDPQIARHDTDLRISWTSSSADGTMFQVYIARKLTWHGTARSVILPLNVPANQTFTVDIGTVGSAEGLTNFSSSLPAIPGGGNKALLTWEGGTYLDPDIAGFKVYQSLVAGGAVSYTTAVADVPAYIQGIITDGWGMGGWGHGGWGHANAKYSWKSAPLSGGVWTFGIKPYDSAGNPGTTQEVSVTISAPPNPPAANSAGQRLTYTVSAGNLTLHWLASP